MTGIELFEILKECKCKTDWDTILLQLRNLDSFDSEYSINAIRDILVGDNILFIRAQYNNKSAVKNQIFRKKVIGFNIIKTEVIDESFGGNVWKFTYLNNGKKLWINAETLWKGGVWRKKWDDEGKRRAIRKQKYGREEKITI